MAEIQYSKIFLIVGVLDISCQYFANCSEVTLLTTEGATTDLRWRVESWNNPQKYAGWEDMSMPYQEKVLRGYQVCDINHASNIANRPETWLLLPEIDVKGMERVFIEMNFTMRECSDLENTCRETFSVYYRSSKKPNDNEKFHPKLYQKIDTVAAEIRWSPVAKNDEMNHEQVDISFGNSSKNLFLHIAIVDAGACVALMGVRVYHKVCRQTVAGFATFQETKTGASDTSLVPIIGSCLPHSSFDDSEEPNDKQLPVGTFSPRFGPLYHCTSSGDWQVKTGSCQCVAGYQPNADETECQPCTKASYKPEKGNNACLRCPINSGTVATGSTSCLCNPGYSVVDLGDAKSSSSENCRMCSKLPGPPQDVRVLLDESEEPGNILLSWKRPADNGGCSTIFYSILCHCVPTTLSVNASEKDDTDCSHVEFLPNFRRVARPKVAIKNLRGHAAYNFTVLTYTAATIYRMSQPLRDALWSVFDNGSFVSALTSWRQNDELLYFLSTSSSSQLYRTSDTPPSGVEDLSIAMENETAIFVTWKRPAFPNGKILYYTVRYALVAGERANNNSSRYIGDGVFLWNEVNTTSTEILLTDLFPHSAYRIVVTAHNSAGSDNASAALHASTLPFTQPMDPDPGDSGNYPFVVATVIVATLALLVGVVLVLQWRCRTHREKERRQSGTADVPAQFRPYNSRHDSLDQRTYVDPFCLKSLPNHQFLCETSPESIAIGEVIGCGEFGEVYKGTLATIDLKTGQETTIDVAVKRLKNQCKPEEQKSFFQEARSLEKFRHPNVVHLEAVVTLTRPFVIVTELMTNGSLHGYLAKLKTKACSDRELPLPHRTMVKMLCGVASGMEYLNGRGYVHRDLAARNVLVSSDMVCKVADFGLLRELDRDSENGVKGDGAYTTSGGKIAMKWTAPEAIAFCTFTQFSDVWSYGILMWEAASYGEKPYWDFTNDAVVAAVNRGMRLPAPNRCPSVLHRLMLSCWQRDPRSRPTFTQIISKLSQALEETGILDVPASPASCGQKEMFFGDENDSTGEADTTDSSDSLLHDNNTNGVTLPTDDVDSSDIPSDSDIDTSDDEIDAFRPNTDEEGSEVSSCTSTICASEITVCASNGVTLYVPLLKTDSDSEDSSRSGTPTGSCYSLH